MTAATYSTEEVAGLLGISTWTLYEAVRHNDAPISPIRVGRRIVWPRAAVHQLLGLENSDAGAATPVITTIKTLTNVSGPHFSGNRHHEP